MNSTKPLIVVVGPTASGKSALAMDIAMRHGGEIIAADSRTVYRGMDIGTAKPTVDDQRQIRHHLLDLRNPDEDFNAAEFKCLAEKAIDDIHGRGNVPILVGGTGLYVDAVLFDYHFGAAADPRKRERLNAMTVEELQELCRQNNIALPINSQNKRHLVRAIEMGGLISHEKTIRAHTLVVGMTMDKDKLKSRIEKRASEMLDQGVAGEAAVLGRKYGWQSEAMKGNVYRILQGVIEGSKTLKTAQEEFVQSDMSLAKRQMTWFRRNPHIIWSDNPKELLDVVDKFLRQYK